MFKKILRLVILATISIVFTVLLLAGFSRIVTPKGSIENFYDEPKNTIQALFIGGSHCAFSVSPIDIYSQTGIKSYNLATGCQPFWVTYHYFKETLKYQKPSVVFLEAFGLFYGKSYASVEETDLVDARDSDRMKPSLNLIQMNLARRNAQASPTYWYNVLNITKYHSRITRLDSSDFSILFQNNYKTGKGFGPMQSQLPFVDFVLPVTNTRQPLYNKCEEYILKAKALADKHGIDLVLFKAPMAVSETDMAILNGISDFAKANDIPFLDLVNNAPANFNFATDMGDAGHVNLFGAQKVSATMAQYLQQTYPHLVSTSPDTLWDIAAKAELQDFVQVEFRMRRTLDLLVQSSATHNNVDIIITRQGELSPQDMVLLVEKLGTQYGDKLVEALQNEQIVVINSGKLYTGTAAAYRLQTADITIAQNASGACTVQQGGTQNNHSRGRDGLNLMLYDNKTNTIFHSFSYAKEHNYDYFTS